MYSFELAMGLLGAFSLAAFAVLVWMAMTKSNPSPLQEDGEDLRKEKEAAIAEAKRWLGTTRGRTRR